MNLVARYVILYSKINSERQGGDMGVCYDKLWKLLIDKHMNKTELIGAAGISTNAMAHLGKNEDVRVEVLIKICNALHCTVDDIMDIISENQEAE